MEISNRAKNVQASATLKAAAKAKELQAKGENIIGLTLGQPDFVTPKNIRSKAIESIENGQASFYTDSSGILPLRKALKTYVKTYYNLDYDPEDFLVSAGAKFSLNTAFQVLVDNEDEVLIPVPYWVSYAEQVKLAAGKPVLVMPSNKKTLKVTPADLEKYVTAKTKVLLLNSPSNPSGMIYTKEELEQLAAFVIKHNLFVIADDIYSRLIYDGVTYHSIVTVDEKMKERTVVVTGVSKTYAMTGWRIGFSFGPKEIMKKMAMIQSQVTSNPTAVSQFAALEAIAGSQEPAEEMRRAFEKRLNKAYELVKNVPGFELEKPQGAFYLFPDVTKAMAMCGYASVDEFVEDLLVKAHVAVVSGTGFGMDSHIRLSYATSEEVFEKGIERILDFLREKSLK